MSATTARRRAEPAPMPGAETLDLIPLGQCLDYLGEKRVTRGWLHALVRRGDIPSKRTLQLPGKRPVVLVDPRQVERFFRENPPKGH